MCTLQDLLCVFSKHSMQMRRICHLSLPKCTNYHGRDACCCDAANKTQFLRAYNVNITISRPLIPQPIIHSCFTYRWMLPAMCSRDKKSGVRHNSVHTSLRERTNGHPLNDCTFTQVSLRVAWFRTAAVRMCSSGYRVLIHTFYLQNH
jgi:hypothetical protein